MGALAEVLMIISTALCGAGALYFLFRKRREARQHDQLYQEASLKSTEFESVQCEVQYTISQTLTQLLNYVRFRPAFAEALHKLLGVGCVQQPWELQLYYQGLNMLMLYPQDGDFAISFGVNPDPTALTEANAALAPCLVMNPESDHLCTTFAAYFLRSSDAWESREVGHLSLQDSEKLIRRWFDSWLPAALELMAQIEQERQAEAKEAYAKQEQWVKAWSHVCSEYYIEPLQISEQNGR